VFVIPSVPTPSATWLPSGATVRRGSTTWCSSASVRTKRASCASGVTSWLLGCGRKC